MANLNHAVEIHGLRRDTVLKRRIEAQMRDQLERIGLSPVSAQVMFVDDNGPKGGPALRCALTVRVPYRPAMRAEHAAENRRLAFDAAFEALARRLERYRERERDSRRHPKKYYAAKRAVEEQIAPPARRPRAARARVR
jgi:ribosome-associated translation inhibitor RaiA